MRFAEKSKPNVLERHGMDQLRRWNRRSASAIHALDATESATLRRLERGTLIGAAVAGALSGAILGGAEVIWSGRMGDLAWDMSREQWQYWAFYLVLVVIVSGLEILFLYWNAIRGAGNISSLAGLQLSREGTGDAVARALVRAALELPNLRERVYWVDPYARTSRWKLTLLAVGYKLKVGATSFLLRILLRRIVGRAAVRFFIPLVAIPVYAIWNTVVTGWVLRQARIRAFGPLAIRELADHVTARRDQLRPECRRLIAQGVGEAIVRTGTAHPNYHLLLGRLVEVLQLSPQEVNVEWDSVRDTVRQLMPEEQQTFLTVLTVAVIIDGSVRKAEAALLEEAHQLCQRPLDWQKINQMRTAFLDGQGIRGE